jgi:hypothetical protein
MIVVVLAISLCRNFESSVTAVLNKSYILENQPYALTEDATTFSRFLIILAGSFI